MEDGVRDRQRPGLGDRARARQRDEGAASRTTRSRPCRLTRFPTSPSTGVHAELPFAAGYMRGSPQREFAFFTESFIDELARAAGMEPLAFRMSMLGGNGAARALPAGGGAARAHGTAAAPGSTMGLAGALGLSDRTSGSVASASIGDDQKVKVHRLVAAVDCGRVVNRGIAQAADRGRADLGAGAGERRRRPNGSRACRARGRSAVLACRGLATRRRSRSRSSRAARRPGGISGLGTLPLAPAVANAIYAGIGQAHASPAVRSDGDGMTRPPTIPILPSRRSACC